MKEMDLILGGFADTALAGLDDPALDAHEALMGENDQELYAWISGSAPAPTEHRVALDRILTYLGSQTP